MGHSVSLSDVHFTPLAQRLLGELMIKIVIWGASLIILVYLIYRMASLEP